MSIFSDAVLKAISDYRQILRRLLEQPDRVRKLNELGLRNGVDPANDLILFEIATRIVKDIEENLSSHNRGYYAYSGVRKFGEFLSEFLQQYSVYKNQVVHRAQHVARAMLLTIQLVGFPEDQLDQAVTDQLIECADTVFTYGSAEQQENFLKALKLARPMAPDFFEPLQAQVREEFVNRESEVDEGMLAKEQAAPPSAEEAA